MSDDGDYDPAPQSGPYCAHWSDPRDCEQECAGCGHTCGDHGGGRDDGCRIDGCLCEQFLEEGDIPTTEHERQMKALGQEVRAALGWRKPGD